MPACLAARAIEHHRPPGGQTPGNGAQETAGKGGEEEEKERAWGCHVGRIERIAVTVTVLAAGSLP